MKCEKCGHDNWGNRIYSARYNAFMRVCHECRFVRIEPPQAKKQMKESWWRKMLRYGV